MLAEQFNMEQDTETKLVGMGMAFLSRLAQQKLGHPPKPTQPGLVHKYTSSDSTLDKIAIIEGVRGLRRMLYAGSHSNGNHAYGYNMA